jgi:hypothetical protein
MKELLELLKMCELGINEKVDIAKGKFESTTFRKDIKREFLNQTIRYE